MAKMIKGLMKAVFCFGAVAAIVYAWMAIGCNILM